MSHLLTHSRIKAYRTCPRLHHNLYNLGIKPLKDADALRFGTLVHKALEAWWRAAMAGLRGDGLLEAALAAIAEHPDAYELARARALVGGYHAKWPPALQGDFEVLAVEREFRVPMRHPRTGLPVPDWYIAGKIDAVVRMDSRVFVVEHKTSSTDFSAGSTYAQRLRLDSQISIYMDGAESLGFQPEAVLYDVLKKPQQKPLKATANPKIKKDGTPYAGTRLADETLDEYQARVIEEVCGSQSALDEHLARWEVPRLEADMAASRRDLTEWWKRIARDLELEDPPANPDSCFRYGRECEFFTACTGTSDLNDPHLFRRTSKHPELEAEGANQ